MTETTTPKPEEKPTASGDITANRRYSPGAKDKPKKLTQRQLIRKLKIEARLHWLSELLYATALRAAAADWPTLYSSRIDGALLPFEGYDDD